MKLAINRESFLKGLQQIQTVISAHPTLPVLHNVRIQADKQGVTLLATDLSVTMRCTVEAAVKKTGASTFPARRLLSIVRELPQADLEFDVSDGNVASILCAASEYKIFGLSADEFPELPKFEESRVVTLQQETLREMLKKTVYAVSTDESRQILNGILMSLRDQKATLVATDGRRLALVEQELEMPADVQAELVVPTKTVQELIKVLRDDGTVKLQWLPNLAAFDLGDVLIVTKLIEGSYPNFRQVIPSQCEERVALDREALLAAIRRVALLASEKNPSVKVTFAKNQVQIVTVTPDVGEARETVPVKYTGKSIAMAFNPEYLMDPLRALTSDEVAVELVDDLSPAVITCEIPFLYVLMPLRLN